MIQQSDVMALLVEAAPGFSQAWAEHLETWGNDALYVAGEEFASHLLQLYQAGDLSTLHLVGKAVEELHVKGSPWVKEFATIGLLEGVQNVWANSNVDPDRFLAFLGPESHRWWVGLNKFWSGQAPLVRADG
ncbi:DUF7674 family protein [Ideonella margarita]|uniref:DUF7674 domain-containing protein n=1 Tax=Ideonella margarita TaxID=2984191 RepID=A0ABU9C1S0_9BURK